ncbi:MAG TPA: hypothetical protein VGM56_24415 [Byssovorax sp.]|jgi:hypothetical protein
MKTLASNVMLVAVVSAMGIGVGGCTVRDEVRPVHPVVRERVVTPVVREKVVVPAPVVRERVVVP